VKKASKWASCRADWADEDRDVFDPDGNRVQLAQTARRLMTEGLGCRCAFALDAGARYVARDALDADIAGALRGQLGPRRRRRVDAHETGNRVGAQVRVFRDRSPATASIASRHRRALDLGRPLTRSRMGQGCDRVLESEAAGHTQSRARERTPRGRLLRAQRFTPRASPKAGSSWCAL